MHYNKSKTPEFNERQAFENEPVSPLTNDKSVNFDIVKRTEIAVILKNNGLKNDERMCLKITATFGNYSI